ncbi:hypothetical protein DM558_08715 [Entomomonas moraniae]|uniref:Uncharacterized protein n=1 Tax=Entomomonas moraniae TaxID=2213226 RepID=A0A3Q9JJC3_9GAMM|nr:hypothetical protein [Entomomonas moraniae]AZS50858.1 hypothetical protein DM558_08715 [Entomomonas moraniae]
MAIENNFIHYTTIYLSRREEILIHSIIALYSSNDGFKWINNGSNARVVMVGSDVKKSSDPSVDPFATITKEQVVCVLGDMFYPKNARALVRIDLPIRALQLVDRLSEIERNYIQTEFSLNYVAASHLAKPNGSKQQIMPEEASSINPLLNRDGMIDFVTTKPTALAEENKRDDQKNDEGVITHLELFKTLDLELEANKLEAKKEAKPFSLELVESLEQEQVYAKKVVNLKLNPTVERSDPLSNKISTFSPISDSVNLKEEIRLAPPTLTDVVSEMPEVMVNKIVDDSQLNNKSVKDKDVNLIDEKDSLINSPSDDDLSKDNALQMVRQNMVEDLIENLPIQAEDKSPRIKLLRWPKADLIQQHPGNAILASMVINMPMSVSDMAKQSDLPVSVCQRFFDAVVSVNVAEYVDQIVSNSEDVSDQPINTNTSKRKGILYRIRAALGLVRK